MCGVYTMGMDRCLVIRGRESVEKTCAGVVWDGDEVTVEMCAV